jgi:hypothetical protein
VEQRTGSAGLPHGVAPPGPGDPATIGAWTVLGRLGSGGMGTVYLARSADGRLAAVKVIRPELAADPAFVSRFRFEVAAARRVAAFCTARVLDAGLEDDSPPWLATEFVAGDRLDEAVRRGGPLDGASLEGLAVGMATALTAIHAAGLVHRDLKPANVLLGPFGPRVIDFGMARAAGSPDASGLTLTGAVVGTPGWMAPEQLTGEPVTPAADVFAWGALVAFAGTGRPPFGTGPVEALTYRIVHGQPDLGGLPERLGRVVAAAMARSPGARPSARDLLLELLGHDAGLAGRELTQGELPAAVTEHLRRTWVVPPADRPTQALGPTATRPRRRRRLLLALLALPLAAALLLAVRELPALQDRPGTDRPTGTTAIAAPATTRPAPTTTTTTIATQGRIGRPVVDGALRFVVASVACNRRTIGDLLPARANGRFCVARLEITNTGQAGRTLVAEDQFLLDTAGRRYGIDDRAMLRLDDPAFILSLPPGTTTNGTLVWDLPRQRKPAAIELHESSGSDGATVRL